MIHTIRAFVKSWFATLLLGILIIAFAVTGIYTYGAGQVGSGQRSDTVASAGGKVLPDVVFQRSFEQQLAAVSQQRAQQRQPAATTEEAVRAGFDVSVLNRLGDELALDVIYDRMGINASDRLVQQQIRNTLGFVNQQDYLAQVARLGLTAVSFENELRRQVAQQHVGAAETVGFLAPRSYTALSAVFMNQARDGDFIAVPDSQFPLPPPPTDAQLTQYLQQHQRDLIRPELRTITIVRFSAAALAPTMQVTPEAVEREFNFRRETLSTPEKRTFVQIPLRNAAQGPAIVARLGRGEDPAAVARSIGVEPITYTDRPRSAVTDTRIAAAAFGMTQGQTSVVQGDVAPAVVRVTAITPGREATLAEHRASIENLLKARMAEQRIYQQNEAYQRAHDAGANMMAAATQAGVTAITIGPITENGAPLTGQPNPALTPEILRTAFHDLVQGQESDIIDTGRGEGFAVRVERIRPSGPLQLNDAREQLAQRYMAETRSDQVMARLRDIQARMDRGEALSAIAASVHGTVGHIAGLTPQAAQQEQVLGPQMIQGLFTARVGRTFIGNVRGGVAVGRLTAIRPGDPAAAGRTAEGARDQMSRVLFFEMNNQAQQWARNRVRVRTNIDRARQILRVDPSVIPAAGTNSTNAAR
jgi:peptidyl-prolyl cis-trans isomerase D